MNARVICCQIDFRKTSSFLSFHWSTNQVYLPWRGVIGVKIRIQRLEAQCWNAISATLFATFQLMCLLNYREGRLFKWHRIPTVPHLQAQNVYNLTIKIISYSMSPLTVTLCQCPEVVTVSGDICIWMFLQTCCFRQVGLTNDRRQFKEHSLSAIEDAAAALRIICQAYYPDFWFLTPPNCSHHRCYCLSFIGFVVNVQSPMMKRSKHLLCHKSGAEVKLACSVR